MSSNINFLGLETEARKLEHLLTKSSLVERAPWSLSKHDNFLHGDSGIDHPSNTHHHHHKVRKPYLKKKPVKLEEIASRAKVQGE
jgi:hypothetical protein